MVQSVVNRVLCGVDFFSIFVRNLNSKLVFQCHHQFHCVQGVRTQISHEGFFVGHLRLFNAELFSNNLFDTQFDIAHRFLSYVVNNQVILSCTSH